jgi:hypothetical protein
MKFLVPNKVMSDFDGYSSLINLNYAISRNPDKYVFLDFSNNIWFEANLFAILGAIRSSAEEQKKSMLFRNMSPTLKNVLERNRFFADSNEYWTPDSRGTIVTYQKFTPYKDIEFMDYILKELLSKPDFPKHSKLLGKKINESIFEIFENARTHGHCANIYTCGQYYPNKTPKILDMTIVDMGKTIKANVNDYLKTSFSGCEAIQWALVDGNTTKTGNVPGGLGLSIIFEFIKLNKGKVQIVSADGYWEYRKGETESKLFENPFPETIVNIEFNLDDTDYYKLVEEISLDDIF